MRPEYRTAPQNKSIPRVNVGFRGIICDMSQSGVYRRPARANSTGSLVLMSLWDKSDKRVTSMLPSPRKSWAGATTFLNMSIPNRELDVGTAWWKNNSEGHNLPTWRRDGATTRGSPFVKKRRIVPWKPCPINKISRKMQGNWCNQMPPSGGCPKGDNDCCFEILCH